MVHRIQQSKIATAEQKAGSVHQALWVTNNLIERYCTSSFWCDLNVYLERFAGNNDSRGGEFAWDDKFALMGTMLTYANYYLRKWGVPVPYFMSGEHIRQPKDRPAMDYQTWYRTMLGVPRVLKEKTEYHKFPAVAGSVIDENGVSWLDSHVADVFHDARRPLWWQAMDHCQGFRDSLTVEFHKGHGVGFVNACKRFLKLNISSRCLEVTERTNGTTLDVHHNSKPVWHWGQFCLRSEEVCNRFKILVDQAQLGYTDPCYKKGYDAMNYANILSWVALAEKANG